MILKKARVPLRISGLISTPVGEVASKVAGLWASLDIVEPEVENRTNRR